MSTVQAALSLRGNRSTGQNVRSALLYYTVPVYTIQYTAPAPVLMVTITFRRFEAGCFSLAILFLKADIFCFY